ncbi:cytochrome c family protein [bacterium]|nr:cytochrome c family protein [bacterium]
MRRSFVGIILLTFAFSLPATTILAQDKAAKKVFKYGGVATCKACHMTKKSGAQYKLWQKGPHAKAFKTLQTPEAIALAKSKGIEDPASADECLKCHVTAHGVDAKLVGAKLKIEEGVGCESCHGPGSEYKPKKIITGIYEGRLKAADYGLIKPVTEEVCVACHNKESPTYKKFVFEERVAEIAHPVPKK